ncbi:MAG: hypothetical protein AAGA03_03240, partial [Planctomycetota bacterium]
MLRESDNVFPRQQLTENRASQGHMSHVNPYQHNQYANPDEIAAFAGEGERASFLRRTYLHLAAAAFGFVAIEAALLNFVPDQVLRSVVGMMGGYGWLVV